MWQKLMRTTDDVAPLVMRLALGLVLFPHGAQKALGWFGGYGYTGTMGYFSSMGIPYIFGVLASAGEFLGSLGLIFGFLTRLSAFGIAVNMVVATLLVHRHVGFFMNWAGTAKGEGYEYHLLAIGLAVALMITGGGRASVDRMLSIGRR